MSGDDSARQHQIWSLGNRQPQEVLLYIWERDGMTLVQLSICPYSYWCEAKMHGIYQISGLVQLPQIFQFIIVKENEILKSWMNLTVQYFWSSNLYI